MPKHIEIRFPTGREGDYYSRVFYLAEELWSAIVNDGLGTLDDTNRPHDEVVDVYLTKNRHYGTVMQIIKKELQRAKLQDDAVITVK